jgi:hypothetical protein
MLMAEKLLQTPGIVTFNSLLSLRELAEGTAVRIDTLELSIFLNSILTRAALYLLCQLIQFSPV